MSCLPFAALTAAVALAATAPARAQPAAPVPSPAAVVDEAADDDARVDWTRGLIIATGSAAADVRAPGAEIARVRSERQARARARAAAQARVAALAAEAVPSGADQVVQREPGAMAARWARLVARDGRDLSVRYGSDGSATVTVGVPLEAVRLAVSGGPAAVSGEPAADAPTAVIVDARSVRARFGPRLGLRIAHAGGEFAAPTVYFTDLQAARGDARLGARPVELGARRYSSGVLTLRDGEGLDKLSAARQPLVVVVLKPRRGGGRAP